MISDTFYHEYYSIHGVYKPSNITGGPHIVYVSSFLYIPFFQCVDPQSAKLSSVTPDLYLRRKSEARRDLAVIRKSMEVNYHVPMIVSMKSINMSMKKESMENESG